MVIYNANSYESYHFIGILLLNNKAAKKLFIYLAICISCWLVFTDCNESSEVYWEDLCVKIGDVKIICFGNSFTQDCMSYVPYILNDVAPQLDVTIGIASMGGFPYMGLIKRLLMVYLPNGKGQLIKQGKLWSCWIMK